MDMTPNENYREYEGWWSIFQGWWAMRFVGLLVVSCLGFNILTIIQFPLVTSFVICALPVLLISAYVMIFVNGRAQSYADDMLKETTFRVRSWMCFKGLSATPVPFEIKQKVPIRP